MDTVSVELSTDEIFPKLMAGNKIKIRLSTVEMEKLRNNLNVFKSRSKKLYEDLALDWESGIIKVDVIKTYAGQAEFDYIFSMEAKPSKRKYACFLIKEDENATG